MTSGADATRRGFARDLGKDTLIYGASSVVPQAVVLAAAPVYTRALGPGGFGVLELLIVVLHLGSIVLMGGLDTASIRLYFSSESQVQKQIVSSTAFLFVGVSGVLGGVAIFLFRREVATGWLEGAVDHQTITIAAIALTMIVISRYSRELLRAQRRPSAYLLNTAVASVLQVGLALWLILVLSFDVAGVMIGYAVGGAVALLMSAYTSRHLLTRHFSLEHLQALLTFGVPLVLSGVAAWLLMFVDRVILEALVGVEQVGIYAVAYRIATVITLVIYAFNKAWTPSILDAASKDLTDARKTQAGTLSLYAIVVAWATVVIAAVAEPAMAIVGGSEFSEGAGLIPIIVFGLAFLGPIPVLQATMLIHNRTMTIAVITVVAATLNVVLNLLLIPFLGTAGAAWATLASFGLQLALYWILANRIDRVRYETRRLVKIFLLTAAFVAALGLLPGGGGAMWIVKGAIAMLFAPALLTARVVTASELRRLPREIRGSDSVQGERL